MSDPDFERFRGWPIKRLLLPGGDRIVLTYCRDGREPPRSTDESNHNVYRLNPAGEVVWQVQRDDRPHPSEVRENRIPPAISPGIGGTREPFMHIHLEHPDGRRVASDCDGEGTEIERWDTGYIIWLVAQSRQQYVLDPETGMTQNVTPASPRGGPS